MQFAWIFAVIVGAVILFLAFYFIGTHLLGERMKHETIEAQAFEMIMNPLSYLGNLGAVTATPLKLTEKAELVIDCKSPSSETELGWNSIEVITERKKERKEPVIRKAYDKYLYADITGEEVKTLQSLTATFDMPWRVADLTMLWSIKKNYCFVEAPDRIINKLGNTTETSLDIKSISFCNNTNMPGCCPLGSTIVCFPKAEEDDYNCEITVSLTTVKKDGLRLFYIGLEDDKSRDALLYAAIFSNKTLYDCNLRRLAKRLSLQTKIYLKKAADGDCGDAPSLKQLQTAANEIVSSSNEITSSQLFILLEAAKAVKTLNRYCPLF